jgi:hypothetical protein
MPVGIGDRAFQQSVAVPAGVARMALAGVEEGAPEAVLLLQPPLRAPPKAEPRRQPLARGGRAGAEPPQPVERGQELPRRAPLRAEAEARHLDLERLVEGETGHDWGPTA